MIDLLKPPDTNRDEDRSWWLKDIQPLQMLSSCCASLSGEASADVAIVGGGFTGMWTALALLDRNPTLSIAVIDAHRCGDGASSRNGGKAHGYWSSLGRLLMQLGISTALETARLGDRAQDQLRAFCTSGGRDCWWQEDGNLLISTSQAQDAKVAEAARVAKELGVPDSLAVISKNEMAQHLKAPLFRCGVLYREGATLHPARLAHYLRAEILRRGCTVYEMTPITRLEETDGKILVRSTGGQMKVDKVVLATNVGLSGLSALYPNLTNFSSYAVMSRPAPEKLMAHGWLNHVGAADLRMFLHYFRRAGERVLMGAGSGPIGYGRDLQARALRLDASSLRRPAVALHRLLPSFTTVDVERSWGWPIDVMSDRLPFATRIKGRNIFCGGGFSGHGVNPTLIIGQCLASLVLGERDDWTNSAFCQRRSPELPPEPFRFIGGNAVRWGIMSCENSEEEGRRPGVAARLCAALPRLTGMSIGLR